MARDVVQGLDFEALTLFVSYPHSSFSFCYLESVSYDSNICITAPKFYCFSLHSVLSILCFVSSFTASHPFTVVPMSFHGGTVRQLKSVFYLQQTSYDFNYIHKHTYVVISCSSFPILLISVSSFFLLKTSLSEFCPLYPHFKNSFF